MIIQNVLFGLKKMFDSGPRPDEYIFQNELAGTLTIIFVVSTVTV